MTLSREFLRTLKHPAVEEFFDLVLFRPVAFGVVIAVRRLPVTPNHLSAVSVIAGIGSGICFSLGTGPGFGLGGLLYGFTRVMDCSDGMLARMKDQATPMGRIVDGFTDYVNAVAMMIGLFAGLLKGGFALPAPPWVLVSLAGLFMIIHGMAVDYRRMEFLSHGLGKANSPELEYAIFKRELAERRARGGGPVARGIIRLYLAYLDVQLRKTVKERRYDREAFFLANKNLLPFWASIGSSTHIFVAMISGLAGRPMIFLVYSIAVANVLFAVLLAVQVRVNRGLAEGPLPPA